MSIPSSSTKTFADVPANRDRLFLASCFALIVTSMTFAIRAGILGDLAADFGLTDVQLGWVNSMAFYGFPLAMLLGGAIYNAVGPKVLLWLAFISHVLGLVLTMTAGGYWGLMISTFLIGFANGSVEAACNPLIADMYPDKQTEMLNKFHVWFPGGIVIGSLIAFFLGGSVSWQVLIATMLVPTAIYGVLILGQSFPKGDNIVSDTGENIKGILTPLFIVMALIMTMTATTEFGATQWVERILGNAGANAMILLAMTAGIMATGRFFAGPLIQSFNPAGVLIGSAVLACLGLFMLSMVTGPLVYVGTAIFALGICYFWPTMLGFTAENLPKSGAFGLSLIGGAGMLGAAIWNPIIGGWIDSGRETALAEGLVGDAAELATGQAALGSIAIFPLILIFVFIGLYLYMKNRAKPDLSTLDAGLQ
ncbi:MFS transporter [Neolewinella agarilytica]|uniref:Predicted arabinose efflux permease, MFS family n=1 Tax=Neolewinella agarilytica TaxID=478744 RepID=A0A1H9DP58_9BACT|nr:MFS transporter [Neolewinella agarilytica]SEQ15274.1 Predicted arabinose efflux permease, MFS family [Neolewinella agarilytica]